MIRYKRGEASVVFRQAVISENMGHINTEEAAVHMMSLYSENDAFLLDYGKDGYLL